MEEDRSAFKLLTGTTLGRPRRRWQDNIRMDLKEIGINTQNWVDSALISLACTMLLVIIFINKYFTAQSHLSTNDKGNNDVIPGAVQISWHLT